MVFIALGGVQVFKSFDLMTWAKIMDVIFKILQNDVIGLFLMMASFELWGNLINKSLKSDFFWLGIRKI